MSNPEMSILRRNDDGSPWSEIRTINGRKTLVAAISVGIYYKVVPATVAIAVINGSRTQKAAGSKTTKSIDRKAATAAALREITGRYARGEVH